MSDKMKKDLVIAQLDTARKALAKADTIQATHKILDMASAALIYAKRQQLGEESIRYATSIKMEALRQLGNMLKATPRQKPGQYKQANGTKKEPFGIPPALSELGLDKKTSKLAQDIALLPEEKFEAVAKGVVTLNQALTKPHVSNNSGNNEWYTPETFINSARDVMGSIDLDPASSHSANKIIKAKKIFTADDNGLDKEWHGNVWMNPPYAQSLMAQFSEAISSKYESNEIDQACVLVNNATETAWFQRMAKTCSSICFLLGRIKYLNEDGVPEKTPLQGQAILYFGLSSKRFHDVFRKFGFTLWNAE